MPRILTKADIANFRDRLCDEAAELWAERGPEGFTMRELSGRLRVSAMTAYRYFRNKEEILEAVRARALGRFADRLERALAGPGSWLEKFEAVGCAYVRFAVEEHVNYKLMFEASPSNPARTPDLTAEEMRVQAAMTASAELLTKQGISGGDSELLGQFLWSTFHGMVMLRFANKLSEPDLENLTSEMLGGVMKICDFAQVRAPARKHVRLVETADADYETAALHT
jgi:AcrR family transcriptional regulator